VTFAVVAVVAVVVAIVQTSAASASLGSVSLEASPSMASTTQCPVDVEQTLVSELETMRSRLVNAATRLPAVEWPVFAASPSTYAGRQVTVRQAHTANGTLRVLAPAVLTLAENIVFAPRADNDYRPTHSDIQSNLAFRLGFFAAISVEAPNVIIDLNERTLRQSVEHSVQQRAPFSLIELANVPFVPGEGPTLFGTRVVSADGVVIENGRLGRSAHHAIHGNGARRVLIRNVVASEYEVAAISLHGASSVFIDRVQATNQFLAIPVMGTYSNARQLVPMAERALATDDIGGQKRLELETRLDALKTLMTQAFNDIVASGRIDAAAHPDAHALFANVHGVPDGNSYSLLLHPRGFAVTNFWSDSPPASGAVESLRSLPFSRPKTWLCAVPLEPCSALPTTTGASNSSTRRLARTRATRSQTCKLPSWTRRSTLRIRVGERRFLARCTAPNIS
jgi:hypothetical protein